MTYAVAHNEYSNEYSKADAASCVPTNITNTGFLLHAERSETKSRNLSAASKIPRGRPLGRLEMTHRGTFRLSYTPAQDDRLTLLSILAIFSISSRDDKLLLSTSRIFYACV